MPIPLLIAGAWAASALFNKGAGLYNDKRISKATNLLREAESYVKAKEGEYTRKRRAYIERMHSYAQLIYAAFEKDQIRTSPRAVSGELPAELKEVWDEMLSGMRSLAPSSADRIGFDPTTNGNIAKGFNVAMSHARHSANPNGASAGVAVAAAAYVALDGANKITNANRAHDKAMVECQRIKQAADLNLNSMQTLYDDLGTRWDCVVVPLISQAIKKPDIASVLLTMADDLTVEADRLMKEITGE